MTKRSQWLDHDEARKHVKALLHKAGAPLELQAWSEANRAAEAYSTENRLVSTSHIVYAPPGQDGLREVDLCTMFYEEFAVGENLGIQLVLRIPVECKYREDVELFGFPEPHGRSDTSQFPIVTSLVGSDLSLLLCTASPKQLRPTVMTVFPLKIKGGNTPDQLAKEDVVFKAGSALYDFVGTTASDVDVDDEPAELAGISRIVAEFESYLGERHYAWWAVLQDWKRKRIRAGDAEEFTKGYVGEGRLYVAVNLWLPVVCLNAPLYEIALRPDGSAADFTPTDFLSTRLRPPGWPRYLIGRAVNVTPEAPLIITNPEGMAVVLEYASLWFDDVKSTIIAADTRMISRAWVESAFYRAVRKRYDNPRGGYFSHHDIERYL